MRKIEFKSWENGWIQDDQLLPEVIGEDSLSSLIGDIEAIKNQPGIDILRQFLYEQIQETSELLLRGDCLRSDHTLNANLMGYYNALRKVCFMFENPREFCNTHITRLTGENSNG